MTLKNETKKCKKDEIVLHKDNFNYKYRSIWKTLSELFQPTDFFLPIQKHGWLTFFPFGNTQGEIYYLNKPKTSENIHLK